jgi:hypothetical protein
MTAVHRPMSGVRKSSKALNVGDERLSVQLVGFCGRKGDGQPGAKMQ